MERTNKDLLKTHINHLINIRNNIAVKSDEITKLKEQKNDVELEINSLLHDLNLEQKIFVLNNNKIQKKEYIQYQSFSIKYLENKLKEYFSLNNINLNINNIMIFLKNNRDKRIKSEIKIY